MAWLSEESFQPQLHCSLKGANLNTTRRYLSPSHIPAKSPFSLISQLLVSIPSFNRLCLLGKDSRRWLPVTHLTWTTGTMDEWKRESHWGWGQCHCPCGHHSLTSSRLPYWQGWARLQSPSSVSSVGAQGHVGLEVALNKLTPCQPAGECGATLSQQHWDKHHCLQAASARANQREQLKGTCNIH